MHSNRDQSIKQIHNQQQNTSGAAKLLQSQPNVQINVH